MQDAQAGMAGEEQFFPACHFVFDVGCNTSDEVMLENIAVNVKRNVRVLLASEAHGHHAVLVGGGPSLKKYLFEVRERQKAGQHVIALNGAAKFLRENGIRPDWCCVIDARPQNAAFVAGDPAYGYLLCSQAHPDVFDAVDPARTLMFHPAGFGDRLKALLPKGPVTEVCGASTSGLFVMATAYAMGYRALHLYGYDSCDEAGDAHAYPQDENAAEAVRINVRVGDQTFSCSHAMAKQAENFKPMAIMLAEAGCDIAVHGDGLIPALAREMTAPFDASVATYDLGAAPASYDFFAWLIIAEMQRRHDGCEKPLRVGFLPGPQLGFRMDGFERFTAHRQQMLDHVMRPALALVGGSEDPTVTNGSLWHNRYTFAPVVEACRRGQEVPILKAPSDVQSKMDKWLAAKGIDNPVVITLRECQHWPHRNSRLANWLRFASVLRGDGEQVVFVRDTAKADEECIEGADFPTCWAAAVDIQARMALYARAKCNLFVGNGPAALAFFSDRPYLMFSPIDPTGKWFPGTDEWWRKNHGIGTGEQFPWSKETQRIVWDLDHYPAIMRAWHALKPLL